MAEIADQLVGVQGFLGDSVDPPEARTLQELLPKTLEDLRIPGVLFSVAGPNASTSPNCCS